MEEVGEAAGYGDLEENFGFKLTEVGGEVGF